MNPVGSKHMSHIEEHGKSITVVSFQACSTAQNWAGPGNESTLTVYVKISQWSIYIHADLLK